MERMALLRCEFFSDVLGQSTEATVLLPQATTRQIGMGGVGGGRAHPVLYLLHGRSDDHSIWTRRTSLERYVAERDLAVVMPTGHRGFYTDQVTGYDYWTFLTEELPDVMRSFFPLSDRREDTFAAGLSMGGYGALKWALRRPQDLAAAASLSGKVDVLDTDQSAGEWRATFGDAEHAVSAGDELFALAAAADPAETPALYQWCGTEDALLDENRRFGEHTRTLGLPIVSEEGPGGHEWEAWDRMIQRVLDWLPLREQAGR
jgi:S-formylglutathione hydrolase FrmB